MQATIRTTYTPYEDHISAQLVTGKLDNNIGQRLKVWKPPYNGCVKINLEVMEGLVLVFFFFWC